MRTTRRLRVECGPSWARMNALLAEDGHSAAVLHSNYKALVNKDQAEAYFGIFPKLNSPVPQ